MKIEDIIIGPRMVGSLHPEGLEIEQTTPQLIINYPISSNLPGRAHDPKILFLLIRSLDIEGL